MSRSPGLTSRGIRPSSYKLHTTVLEIGIDHSAAPHQPIVAGETVRDPTGARATERLGESGAGAVTWEYEDPTSLCAALTMRRHSRSVSGQLVQPTPHPRRSIRERKRRSGRLLSGRQHRHDHQGSSPGSGKSPLAAVMSVELRGLEPLTPSLRTRCATSCATAPWCGRNDNTESHPVRNEPGRLHAGRVPTGLIDSLVRVAKSRGNRPTTGSVV